MDKITSMDKIASTREAFIAGLMDVAPNDPKICLVFRRFAEGGARHSVCGEISGAMF